jgi:spiro-SPASM protein
MNNLAIINIAGLSPLAYQNVLGGPPAFQRVMEWAMNIPGAAGIVLLADARSPLPAGAVSAADGTFAPVRVILRDQWNEQVLVEALAEASRLPASAAEGSSRSAPLPESATASQVYEGLFYAWGDSPLIDGKLTETLWNLHYKYDAEYTFADGYPIGLSPEILSGSMPAKLLPLASGRTGPVARDSLFEVLRRDINAFDVETHLSPADMRMDRVSATCDTRRNRDIMERLAAAGGIDAESLCRLIPEQKILLRSLPAFFPVQITDHCPQACSYCPFPVAGGDPRNGRQHMDKDRFEDLCARFVDFAGDAVIGLSLWGEPASHPQIGSLIRAALSSGPETRVLIETSGIGWNGSLLEELAAEVPPGRLLWIVSLDSSDPGLYDRLRGGGFAEAEAAAEKLSSLFGRYCWLQGVRMLENYEHLDDFFYTRWKEKGAQVIVQKYDSYAGLLPERQPADLSPLRRFPCWHLKRDMPILLNGDVPFCRTDLGRRASLGNVFTGSLDAIWAAGEGLYADHVAGRYPEHCAGCDEYYTFNF